MHSNTALLLYAVIAVVGLVVLIVRFKVSAFVALILASVFIGLCSKMSPEQILRSFEAGVGGVLGSVAIIIGLGTILGSVLAETRGAEVVSGKISQAFGIKYLPVGFMIIGLLVCLPIFFAVGIVLLVPILYSVARERQVPLLLIGLPMVAGLSAAHGFIPPHPGPLAAIKVLDAALGKTILYSLPVAAVSAFVAGPLFVRLLKAEQLAVAGEAPISAGVKDRGQPAFGRTLVAIVLPVALMTLSTLSFVLPEESDVIRPTLALIGHPVLALVIGVLFAWLALARPARFSRDEILRFSEASLGPVAGIILIIGAGAGFSRVLIDSGVGSAVAEIATRWSLPVLPMGFVIAGLIRVATGSATVAITTCAGLVKPMAEAQAGTNLELLVLAMGAGSLILSHVNDGGFWLVKGYLNLTVPQALRTWTVLETILGVTGFICILLLDLIF